MQTINDLRLGDFVMPLPLGLQITVQYNTEGNIEKIYSGYKDRVDITHDVVGIMIAKKTVPAKISISGCTTWVFGVLYTSETVEKTAVLPEGITEELIELYKEEPTRFNFFAATIETSNGSITGSIAMRRALAMQQFRILPGWDLFSKFHDKLLSLWLADEKYTFKPVVTDLVALGRDSGIMYVHLGGTQVLVNSIRNLVDTNGYLKSALTSAESNDNALVIDYADRVYYHVEKGTVAYFKANGELVYNNTMNLAEKPAPIRCNKCGRLIEIPTRGAAICSNPHCVSKLVPVLRTFIAELGLPTIDTATLKSYVDNQALTCIPDLFTLTEYHDCMIELSVAKLLRAMIPYDVIPRDDVLMLFTTACMENPKTIQYYMLNPEQIPTDLRIQHMDLPALQEWFLDDANVSDITNLMSMPQIKISDSNKKFDGAPIFRDKLICITGTFLHGAMGYVSSILQSYSAKVTTTMSNNVDCVLVGGTHENVDGRILVSARQMRKPIYEELDFFAAYDIDNDIQQANLV